MSLSRIMNISSQSMANAKTSIATSSHNIANADTEGYSRQRVDTKTNYPIVRQDYTMGTGAKIKGVKRLNDDFVELQIRNDTSRKGEYQALFNGCKQLENLFNEATEKGIAHYMSEFYSSLQRLSENPDQGAIREMVKVSAQDMSSSFNQVYKQIGWIREDLDNRVDELVKEVNHLAGDISELNGSIKQFKIMGKNANDFMDERNVKFKRLAEIIDIKVIEDENGNCIVRVANSGNLVDNTDVFKVVTPRNFGGLGEKKLVLVSPTGGEKEITQDITSGEVFGYLKFRSQELEETLDKLNTLAGTIVTGFNEIHREGYGLNGSTGIDFFEGVPLIENPETGQMSYDFSAAAKNIKVTDEIESRTASIAAAFEPNAVADNRNALEILDFTTNKVLDEGLSTMDDFYNGMVGVVGLRLSRVEKTLNHQTGILSQLDNIRESISGVSLDEETAELMKHQHNFDASARLIKVADELFDTVLNLKR